MVMFPHLAGHPGSDTASLEEVVDITLTCDMRNTRRNKASFMALEVWCILAMQLWHRFKPVLNYSLVTIM